MPRVVAEVVGVGAAVAQETGPEPVVVGLVAAGPGGGRRVQGVVEGVRRGAEGPPVAAARRVVLLVAARLPRAAAAAAGAAGSAGAAGDAGRAAGPGARETAARRAEPARTEAALVAGTLQGVVARRDKREGVERVVVVDGRRGAAKVVADLPAEPSRAFGPAVAEVEREVRPAAGGRRRRRRARVGDGRRAPPPRGRVSCAGAPGSGRPGGPGARPGDTRARGPASGVAPGPTLLLPKEESGGSHRGGLQGRVCAPLSLSK